MLNYQQVPLPGGVLTVISEPSSDAVVFATFREPTKELSQLSSQLRRRSVPSIRKALEAYADGDLTEIDAIAVQQPGSQFRQQAWLAMREIPAGEVMTYAQLAARIGHPGAARAAGTACATNQIPIFIPCHRVVAARGLGGYAFGLPVKQQLLDHEGRVQ